MWQPLCRVAVLLRHYRVEKAKADGGVCTDCTVLVVLARQRGVTCQIELDLLGARFVGFIMWRSLAPSRPTLFSERVFQIKLVQECCG